jgi:hypothetical protein
MAGLGARQNSQPLGTIEDARRARGTYPAEGRSQTITEGDHGGAAATRAGHAACCYPGRQQGPVVTPSPSAVHAGLTASFAS